MAAVIKGVGVVWSVGALTFTGSGSISSTSGTNHFTQSAEAERTSEVTRIKDNGGTIKAVIFHGNLKRLRMTVIPVGTTPATGIADARTAADTLLPAAGTKISVTDDSGTIIDDSYNCLSAKQNRTVDGVSTIDIEMEGSDEGVQITTVVA